jgi:cytochrome c biogenesis protein CcdA
MTLLIVSFLAWILTILAPCVLPLLPVILWASAADSENKYRPYIIILSLIFSIVLFSLLLKASTVFIWVDPIVWKLFSGGVLILFWIITIFPNLYKNFSTKIWFAWKSSENLWKNAQKKWTIWAVLVWMSLWPVFSSCSPTYAVILAVILPVSFLTGLLNLFAYAIWLGLVLLIITIFWQKFIKKAKWASSPNWIFKKVLWILFLVIWLAIITGYDKVVETAILNSWYFDITVIEQQILDKAGIEQ